LKKIIGIISLLLLLIGTHAQIRDNFRYKSLELESDTIKLDSLSIIPGTIKLTSNGSQLDSSQYTINCVKSLLILKDLSTVSTIQISYKVFPFDYSKPVFHKGKSLLEKDPDSTGYNYVMSYDNASNYEFENTKLSLY